MKIKLISGKRLPRYAVICANFAVVDNFPIGDFHKLQNGQTVDVDALIGDQLIAGGWCKIVNLKTAEMIDADIKKAAEITGEDEEGD